MSIKFYTSKKLLIISILILFLLTGLRPVAQINRLTILSYNIHHGEGMDGIIDLERIAKIINTISPDLVAFQEVDLNTDRSGQINQLEELATLCKMNFAFGKAMEFDNGLYGNAILSRYPILEEKTYPLPGEPRSALVTKIKLVDNSEVAFISLHLDVDEDARKESIQPLLKIIQQYDDKLLIVAGDFNSQPNDEVILQLQNNLINVTNGILTFSSVNPKEQLDYILISNKLNVNVISSKALNEQIASDHLPLYSVIEFGEK